VGLRVVRLAQGLWVGRGAWSASVCAPRVSRWVPWFGPIWATSHPFAQDALLVARRQPGSWVGDGCSGSPVDAFTHRGDANGLALVARPPHPTRSLPALRLRPDGQRERAVSGVRGRDMKRASRRSRALRWTCTAACILALAVPLGRNCYARWRFASPWPGSGSAQAQAAELFAMFTGGLLPGGTMPPRIVSLSDWPFFAVFFAFAISGVCLWQRDCRAIPLGHCKVCGYDLTGNVSGRCPECGTAITSG